MYTGRTPYPGSKTKASEDMALAKTLETAINSDEEFYQALVKNGKLPAKENLKSFIGRLKISDHTPDPEDAELITRFEMQKCSPDILITNYSMLEYMLFRPREQKIWDDTRKWLNQSPDNKLLFIIDEAHMYRGSSGGEVALLIKRFMHNLNIDREKIQFILTTASMPDGDELSKKTILNFANDLTGKTKGNEFIYLTGERMKLKTSGLSDIPISRFLQFAPSDFEATEDKTLEKLKEFWCDLADIRKCSNSYREMCIFLYDNIANYRPFSILIDSCRGKAVSLDELAEKIFSTESKKESIYAVEVMLSIAILAKSSHGIVLFPARMHMLFRGIKGVYACVNKKCSHSHSDKHLTIGEVFLSEERLCCPHCGSVVYELYQDRRCGALFYKGYVVENEIKSNNMAYLWHYHGQILDKSIKEIHLYIPEENYVYNAKSAHIHPCYIDINSGFIDFTDDSKEYDPNFRKLYYGDYTGKGRPDVFTFSVCPHCRHNFSTMQLSSFATKGNNAFFNLIQTNFQLQPPVKGKDNNPDKLPNEGRKELLFSDSRGRAAKLARDMTEASETMAARQLFALSIAMMEHYDGCSMNDLYDFFCIQAGKQHLQIFQDESRDIFLGQCRKAIRKFERRKKQNRTYEPELDLTNAPDLMQKYLLKLFSGGYNTLMDSADSWLEPTQTALEDAIDDLDESGIYVDEESFLEIFNAWILYVCDTYTALGHTIKNEIREEVRKTYNGYGIPKDWSFSDKILGSLNWKKDDKITLIWRRVLRDTFLSPSTNDNSRYYVNLTKIRPRLNRDHIWHKCEVCSEITAFPLSGRCPICGNDKIHPMTESEISALNFWRSPVTDALNNLPIRCIDTEEHTAQLSYKDQRDALWSKSERYEQRFQDILQENETPVDILSSTTTMEVGIDIGSLVAVGLRNIPPMRENYQQRAGRAGRRGSSLSTIITFCEDGPHDTLYFKDPAPMFRGDPRKPWIDVHSTKLIERHLNMIVMTEYCFRIGKSMDIFSVSDFINDYLDDFFSFIAVYDSKDIEEFDLTHIKYKDSLISGLNFLSKKIQDHPELYGVSETGTYSESKSLLDALYEEGLIPTYSFPKNVVSTYITNEEGKIKYQVERSLDIAIGEYAPGRSLVVDKQTYQIGGFFVPNSDRRKGTLLTPARAFVNDPNYVKNIIGCSICGWFGLRDDEQKNGKNCPFCGSDKIESELPLLRPWGFAPRNGKSIFEAQLSEVYTNVQLPLYSTLPQAEEMIDITEYKNIRMASRANQRIIMINKGENGKGFIVCKDCGAALPGNTVKALKDQKIERPYNNRLAYGKKCKHEDCLNTNIGYDFITDMLVLEISIDDNLIDLDIQNNPWVNRAALSIAEAFRLAVSYELDIEFGELQSGYRIRKNYGGSYIDIYMYDNLSSGAGYSVSVSNDIKSIISRVRAILSNCNCANACYNCLKHYNNQFLHGSLDRFAALDLLNWAIDSELPDQISQAEQERLLVPLKDILAYSGFTLSTNSNELISINNVVRPIRVYPAICKHKHRTEIVSISDTMLKYAKPYAINSIINQMH